MRDFPDTYSYSKRMAEHLLAAVNIKASKPVNIVMIRPNCDFGDLLVSHLKRGTDSIMGSSIKCAIRLHKSVCGRLHSGFEATEVLVYTAPNML